MKLTEAQRRWLLQPGEYAYLHHGDGWRTFKALLRKGAVEITEPAHGNERSRFRITSAGRSALKDGEGK